MRSEKIFLFAKIFQGICKPTKIDGLPSVSLFFQSFFRANKYLTDANKNNLFTVAPKKDKQNENNILKLH